jgi:hypothetical protein
MDEDRRVVDAVLTSGERIVAVGGQTRSVRTQPTTSS